MKNKRFVKIISVCMASVLVISSMSGCGKEKEKPDDSVKVSQEENEPRKTTPETKEGISGEKPDDSAEKEPELGGTVQLMDALMMCMEENGRTYESADREFFWLSMHYALMLCGQEHSLAEIENDQLKIPRQAVQEFASGLFADYSDLPEVPETMQGAVRYDESWDAYYVQLGDRGGSTAKILESKENDGQKIITIGLFSDADETEEEICRYQFTIVPNSYADGVENPIFSYSILKAERISGIN